jgi:hypothetical protein
VVLRAGRSEVRIPARPKVTSLVQTIHICFGARRAPSSMPTGILLLEKTVRGQRLTNYLYLEPTLRMRRVMHLLPL